MRCPQCRTENAEESKFCRECATPLPKSGGPTGSFTKTLESPLPEPIRGTVFADRYEIIEELGAGGMGRVFRAHDTKLNEEVALKLIRTEFAAERRIVERFRNEIKVTRKITHKNVCRMHDLHEEGKFLFLTMEYVRGEDLKSLIHRTRALAVGSAVFYARQIAEGLTQAHQLGIVHRDLKPGNIMIDKEGQAKVMDFGIARMRQEKGMTGEGAVVGTPEYMSPEQVDGKPADARSDIYALGAILFEMVVGRPPFEGETPFSIANKHKMEPPPVPKKLLPELPEALNRLILRCLEKDRFKRYQTAEELAADLGAMEQALPLTERALTRARTKIRTSREITVKLTPRKLIIPAAAIFALAIAIVILPSFFKPPVGTLNSIAILPLADTSPTKLEGYVDGIHDALITTLSKVPSLNVISRRDVSSFRETSQSYLEISRKLKVAAIAGGSLIRTGERTRITVELFDGRSGKRIWGPRSFDRGNVEILSLLDELALTIAREINAQLTAGDIARLSRSRKVHPEAYKLYLQAKSLLDAREDKPADFAAEQEGIVTFFRRSVEIDPAFALGYAGLANYYSLGAINGVLPRDEVFPKAKELALKALSLDDSLSEAHSALGNVLFGYEWNLPGAEREFNKALGLGVEGSRTSYLTTMNYLVLVGRSDEAIALVKRAIESNPLSPDYANLGWALGYARRDGEAIEAAKRSIELRLNVQSARFLLIGLYAASKNCTDAVRETEAFVADYASDAADPGFAATIAVGYALCGHRAKAEQWAEVVKEGISKHPAQYSADNLGYIYAALGENERAIAALEKAYEQHSAGMLWLKVEPVFDVLREDARFKALLKKIGFEK
jgi:serine/threonine protein kinase